MGEVIIDHISMLNDTGILTLLQIVMLGLLIITMIVFSVVLIRFVSNQALKQQDLEKRWHGNQNYNARINIYTKLSSYVEDVRHYKGIAGEDYREKELLAIYIQSEAFFDHYCCELLRKAYDHISAQSKNMSLYISNGQKVKWSFTQNEIINNLESARMMMFRKYIDVKDAEI